MRGNGLPLRALVVVGLLLSLAAFVIPPSTQSSAAGRSPAHRAAPAGPPRAEPLEFEPLDRDQALTINAATPFAAHGGPAAKPFQLSGSEESRTRALDCLASAMWYEAGDDAKGQRAVAQVVLNRVRHPAFPATVCGVVFQGSERSTGCQFTFTCDGAMARVPSPAALARARERAGAMLAGNVDAAPGLATHYHTDWVHPVWSAEMDKIARVDTHLFFRWRGTWGSLGALRQAYAGNEPAIPALARLSPFHHPAEQDEPLAFALGSAEAAASVTPAVLQPTASAGPVQVAEGVFQMAMAPGGIGGVQAMRALDLCGARDFCRVVGQLAGAEGDVAFVYARDRRTGVEKALWNCSAFKRLNAGECLTPANRFWLHFDGNLHGGAPSRAARAS